jgi:hypothetical protein
MKELTPQEEFKKFAGRSYKRIQDEGLMGWTETKGLACDLFDNTVTRLVMKALGYSSFIKTLERKSGSQDSLICFSDFLEECTPFAFPVLVCSRQAPLKLTPELIFDGMTRTAMYKTMEKYPGSLIIMPAHGFTSAGGLAMFQTALADFENGGILFKRVQDGYVAVARTGVLINYLVKTGDIVLYDGQGHEENYYYLSGGE